MKFLHIFSIVFDDQFCTKVAIFAILLLFGFRLVFHRIPVTNSASIDCLTLQFVEFGVRFFATFP